jgi:hypothetical protein
MANIKDKILSHARSKNPDYAERMEIFEPNLPGLPAGLTHYAVNINGLFDYTPISYICLGDDCFSSLMPDDFGALMKHLQLLESNRLAAIDVAILYLLIDFPSRDRSIVETMEEVPLPDDPPAILTQKVSAVISPAHLDKSSGRGELTFFCYNRRSGWLEQFSLVIYPSYHYTGELNEVIDLFNRHENL